MEDFVKPIIALTDFSQKLPPIEMKQEASLEHIANAHALADEAQSDRLHTLLKRYGVKPEQISRRFVENLDLAKDGKDILERTQFFSDRARQVVASFYEEEKPVPDHIVHVTCTGYVSPSPAQHLVNDKSWAGKTDVTHAYHMGCYAALPAVRIADGLVAARNKRVDIVHTEMCGLHMDRKDHSPEQMVVQSLFADGHIKYSAVPAEMATKGFKVLGIREFIVPDSQKDMSWITASWGMKMSLSRDVPEKIGSSLRPFVMNLCTSLDVDFSEVLKNGVFAIHPGGPKIIQAVSDILELTPAQSQASRDVLFERGNMSSATLPHVWDKLLNQENIPSKKKVLSLAFGPGLTIFGALFESI
jgi:predicted naringenin-chalcone synthase